MLPVADILFRAGLSAVACIVLLFVYDLWAESAHRKIGLGLGFGILAFVIVFRTALMIVGAYTLAFAGAYGFAALQVPMGDIGVPILGGLGAISGLWATSILSQVIDNLACRYVGKPVQRIEWWRGQHKRRGKPRKRTKPSGAT